MKWIVILLLLLLFGCIETKRQPFLKLRSFHHDHQCFTQGLQIRDGRIVESCGLNGKSSIRIVHSQNGTIIMERKLPYKYFAEGLVVVNNSIYVLTWKNKEILVLDLETLNILESRPFSTYSGEGWGLSYNGEHLIASDGSSRLNFLEIPPLGSNGVFKNVRELNVYDPVTKKSIKNINELEYWNGFIYANIWYEDVIHQIDLETGQVFSTFDMANLYPKRQRIPEADCLNGIAFNASDNTFILTGKLWPQYHVVQFVSGKARIPSRRDSELK